MDQEPPNIFSTIERKPIRETGVDFSPPVILCDNEGYQVQLVTLYPKRKSEAVFQIKTFRKIRGGLQLSLERSVQLDEKMARCLLEGLRSHLMVSETGSNGTYIIVKVVKDKIETDETDPRRIAQAISSLLADEKIAKHLSEQELGCALRESLAGAIRISELRSALAVLRNNLDEGIGDEKIYQDWCQEHTWAFGNAYVMKNTVRTVSPGDKLDLLLPTVLTGYREIIELKRPDMSVIHHDSSHNNYYFSQDASRAIGQCHRYVDALHELASNGLRDHPHIVAYHPRAVIVMGRSHTWSPEQIKALHGLNRGMHHTTLITYDQLLAQGARALQIVESKREGVFPTSLDDEHDEESDNWAEPPLGHFTVAEHAKPSV